MAQRISKINTVKARTIATRSFVAILGVLLGVLVSAQWRSLPDRVTDPVAPYVSLRETKEDLYSEQDQLKKEIQNLRLSLSQAQKDSENITLTKDELTSLKIKKSQAGLTKLNGPGVIIDLNDSKDSITSEESIIHAADLRDIVNLLWGSGAEAISINGQRVVVNTAIDCIVNTILVNNVRLTAPFRIEAIGDQNLMYDHISNPDILSNLHQRKKSQGIVFDINKNNDITTPVFDGSFDFNSGKAE